MNLKLLNFKFPNFILFFVLIFLRTCFDFKISQGLVSKEKQKWISGFKENSSEILFLEWFLLFCYQSTHVQLYLTMACTYFQFDVNTQELIINLFFLYFVLMIIDKSVIIPSL